MKTARLMLALLLAFSLGDIARAGHTPGVDASQRAADLAAVKQLREGMVKTLEFINQSPGVFKPSSEPSPQRDDKAIALQTWKRLLDYRIALDTIEEEYDSYSLPKNGEDSFVDDAAFHVHYAAFLAQYRWNLEFIKAMESYPYADTVFNEPLPDLGLEKNSYADLKLRFLNAGTASRFAALNTLDNLNLKRQTTKERQWMEADRDALWGFGNGKGIDMTAQNAWQVVKDLGQAAFLPVQKNVGIAMGRTKVLRHGTNLITQKQAEEMTKRVEPGDFFLERREWYLSNVGIPGFWTHAALYVGTSEERSKFFTGPEVEAWVKAQGGTDGDFEHLLAARFPEAYKASQAKASHPLNVVEAVEKGVVFSPAAESAAADSIAVLRPRLSLAEKAQAVYRAFGYAGRPYDYEFDFLTDTALVCSELVYKCYEPSKGFRGICFPKTITMGKFLTAPNEFAKQFDEQFGTSQQQSDLVVFFDGYEGAKMAVEEVAQNFRESWKRPKWHILVQGDPATQGEGK